MARLTTLDPDQFPPELLAELGDDATAPPEHLGSLRVLAQRPELAVAFLQFRAALARSKLLGARLVELVRLRVAYHNQCRSCMAMRSADAVSHGMSDDVVCSLAAPEEANDLTERERAALRYADLVATAPQDIDDGVFKLLHQHFTEGEIVELGVHIAVFIGFGRIAMSWDLVDDLPDAYRRDGTVGPWEAPGLVRAH